MTWAPEAAKGKTPCILEALLVGRLDGAFEHGGSTPAIFKSHYVMDHERISQICFAETYVVPSHQTARSLFTRLPHGQAYADTLIECIATGYLIAVLESICIKAMQEHIDPAAEVVVGRSIRVEHCGPIPPGATMRVSGWVEQLSNRSATFRVTAHDDHERICDGQVTLVAAERRLIESRIAIKVDRLSATEPLAAQVSSLAR